MVYGVILAAGVGKRMGLDVPKQYVEIEGKPIIIYTIEAFISNSNIDKIYVAVSPVWKDDVLALLQKHLGDEANNIIIVEGGEERVDTIMNVKDAIVNTNDISDDDVVVFHDAVRPFIPDEVIDDSIEGARKYKAVVAGIKAEDTILYTSDGVEVDDVLDRSKIYHGQAPDSFNVKYFIELSEMLTDEQRKKITGTSQFCSFNNKPMYISKGSKHNFKITTIEDLDKAKEYVRKRKK